MDDEDDGRTAARTRSRHRTTTTTRTMTTTTATPRARRRRRRRWRSASASARSPTRRSCRAARTSWSTCSFSATRSSGENEWATFLSDHGGEDNGETSWETTTFYFDVEPKYLKPALERFAAFFVAPTFDFDASEREVKAIESEFQQAKHRDGDRVSQLRCHLCADGHPHKGFGWGDARSLVDQPAAAGVDVRAEMHKFHESHYSANLMTAVVVGFENLDELQALAVDTLAPISDRDVVRPAFGGGAPAPPPPVALPRVVRVVPQKKARTLEPLGRCRRCGRTCAPSLRSTSSTCSATRGAGPRAAQSARARHLALRGRRGRRGDECARPLLCHGRAHRGGTRRRRWRRLRRPRRPRIPRAPPRRAVGVRRDAADRIAPLPLRAARGRARVRAPPRVGDAAPPAARRAPHHRRLAARVCAALGRRRARRPHARFVLGVRRRRRT